MIAAATVTPCILQDCFFFPSLILYVLEIYQRHLVKAVRFILGQEKEGGEKVCKKTLRKTEGSLFFDEYKEKTARGWEKLYAPFSVR